MKYVKKYVYSENGKRFHYNQLGWIIKSSVYDNDLSTEILYKYIFLSDKTDDPYRNLAKCNCCSNILSFNDNFSVKSFWPIIMSSNSTHTYLYHDHNIFHTELNCANNIEYCSIKDNCYRMSFAYFKSKKSEGIEEKLNGVSIGKALIELRLCNKCTNRAKKIINFRGWLSNGNDWDSVVLNLKRLIGKWSDWTEGIEYSTPIWRKLFSTKMLVIEKALCNENCVSSNISSLPKDVLYVIATSLIQSIQKDAVIKISAWYKIVKTKNSVIKTKCVINKKTLL